MVDDPGVPTTLLFTDCVAVFQGGGCRAAAHAGAYAAAYERGVHFHELAGASAGAIVATLIAAGAGTEWLDQKIATLDFPSFMEPPTGPVSRQIPRALRRVTWGRARKAFDLMSYQSLYSGEKIEQWMEEALRELLPDGTRPSIVFRDLKLPVAVISAGLREGRAVNYGTESTPTTSVASAVRASCAMPFFFQAVDGQVDGGVLSNLPAHLVSSDDEPRPVLAFALEDDSTRNDPSDLLHYANALVDTVVRGSQELQTQIQSNLHIITINTGDVRATDFDRITDDEVQRLRHAGYTSASNFFGRENLTQAVSSAEFQTKHRAQTWDVLAQEFLNATNEVCISSDNTLWVSELFMALTSALMKGVRVKVLLTPYHGQSPRPLYQRRLLALIGCEVATPSNESLMPVEAFLFDRTTPRAAAVIMGSGEEIHATIHRSSAGESGVLDLLSSSFENASVFVDYSAVHVPTALERGNEQDVVDYLAPVDQYTEQTSIGLEDVPLDSVDSWAKYAMSYKQRQQQRAVRMFRAYDVNPFEPAWLVMANGVRTLLMPPVVELSPSRDSYTIVNGASRLLLLQREGHQSAPCAVVRGVASPAPARGVHPLANLPVRVGKRNDPTHRYDDFKQAHVRRVEHFAHSMDSLRSHGDSPESS